jgi:hypothetical protein
VQDAWRTLVAVEMGMKNHEFVPAPLVDTIAGLRNGARPTHALLDSSLSAATHLRRARSLCATGGAFKQMRNLLKNKLVHHDSSKYDGYRLTPLVRARCTCVRRRRLRAACVRCALRAAPHTQRGTRRPTTTHRDVQRQRRTVERAGARLSPPASRAPCGGCAHTLGG